MIKTNRGFTLIELLVVIAVVAIISVIAYPNFQVWMRNARYKEAARDVASVLLDARARAISANLEHRVELNVGTTPDQYRVTSGNRAYGSTSYTTVVTSWNRFSKFVDLTANANCDVSTGTIYVSFNPNGSGSSQYICTMDLDGNRKFRSGVTSSTTGRVRVERWNAGSSTWE